MLPAFRRAAMRNLSAVALLAALTAVGAGPVGNVTMEKHDGPCYQENMRCMQEGGACCPQCDSYGYFLPKQCSKARGCCWCVEVLTGKVVPDTETMGGYDLDCASMAKCPRDWHYYDHRCFLFVNESKMWCEAEKYCQFHWANLASVHSDKEYEYLQAMTLGDSHHLQEAWLGGHDLAKPEFWMWSDGSRFDRKRFYHPEDAEKEGCCLKMNYGFDKMCTAGNCSESLPFFCSKIPGLSEWMKDSM